MIIYEKEYLDRLLEVIGGGVETSYRKSMSDCVKILAEVREVVKMRIKGAEDLLDGDRKRSANRERK